MTLGADSVVEEALGWLIRVNEAGFRDWDAFHDWLDQDPAYVDCYWRLARADANFGDNLSVWPPGEQTWPSSRLFCWVAAGTGLAAVIALFFTVPPRQPDDVLFETAPGGTRTIVLHIVSRIDVNTASRVRMAQGDELRVQL